MDKYVNERELVSLPENEEDMAKRTPEERIHELEAENQRLSKALKLEKLRCAGYVSSSAQQSTAAVSFRPDTPDCPRSDQNIYDFGHFIKLNSIKIA